MKAANYVLVADSGLAKLYAADAGFKSLELLYTQANPDGRKMRSELDSDRPGVQRSSSGGTHGLGGDQNSQRHESEKFAKYLCKGLSQDKQENKFESLALVAPPHFLGELRSNLDNACQKVLVKTLAKDLLRADEVVIASHLV